MVYCSPEYPKSMMPVLGQAGKMILTTLCVYGSFNVLSVHRIVG